MASFSKKSNGRYKVRWRTLGGQARARTVPSKRAAIALCAEIEEFQGRGREWEPRVARPVPRLRAVMETFLRERSRILLPATILSYGTTLEMFCRWVEDRHGKHAGPDVLCRSLLGAWYQHLSETPGASGRLRAESTVRCNLRIIHIAWKWAFDHDEDHGWDGQVPRFRQLELRRAPLPAPTRAPTWAQMDAVIGQLTGWHRHLGILLRCSGLRRGAALALRWTHLDLEKAELDLPAEITKGHYGGRRVPLSPHLVQELERWDRSGPWVVSGVPAAQRKRTLVNRVFRRAWQATGAEPEIWHQRPCHSFRKGFVSGLRQAGVDPDAVEILVGHTLGRVRGAYIDPVLAVDLREAVACVPPLGTAAVDPTP
ncbi:MAG: tyrosine-type recombinase/integrase [Alphaproteobacteria bacterium]|nr:tyrosine-type recombinase/integrase [Alphaproteobacteria bacterium]